ncbi:hypothetical protein BpHYR1_041598, partial [Brachionus plicatilis]
RLKIRTLDAELQFVRELWTKRRFLLLFSFTNSLVIQGSFIYIMSVKFNFPVDETESHAQL